MSRHNLQHADTGAAVYPVRVQVHTPENPQYKGYIDLRGIGNYRGCGRGWVEVGEYNETRRTMTLYRWTYADSIDDEGSASQNIDSIKLEIGTRLFRAVDGERWRLLCDFSSGAACIFTLYPLIAD